MMAPTGLVYNSMPQAQTGIMMPSVQGMVGAQGMIGAQGMVGIAPMIGTQPMMMGVPMMPMGVPMMGVSPMSAPMASPMMTTMPVNYEAQYSAGYNPMLCTGAPSMSLVSQIGRTPFLTPNTVMNPQRIQSNLMPPATNTGGSSQGNTQPGKEKI